MTTKNIILEFSTSYAIDFVYFLLSRLEIGYPNF